VAGMLVQNTLKYCSKEKEKKRRKRMGGVSLIFLFPLFFYQKKPKVPAQVWNRQPLPGLQRSVRLFPDLSDAAKPHVLAGEVRGCPGGVPGNKNNINKKRQNRTEQNTG
jgi:hypothetical protein